MKQFHLLLIVLFLLISTDLKSQPYKLWATYYGDGAQLPAVGTEASSVVYDPAGFVYIAGFAFDSTINIATPNSFKTHMSGFSDVYLAKFDTLGNRIWSTYIGNEGGEWQPCITLDGNGNIFVAGQTQGLENIIATPGTFRPAIPVTVNNVNYSYLIKFNPQGQRLWGTYLDLNSAIDSTRYYPAALTTDGLGNILIVGKALGAASFPSPNTHLPIPPDQLNGFVLKLNPAGQFVWGTYYGGDTEDGVNSVSCNTNGEIYISGLTTSTSGIATPGVSYPVWNAPLFERDGFLAKLSADGQRIWGTYTNGILTTGGIVYNGNGFYLAGTTARDTGIATAGTYLQQYSDSIDYCLSRWSDNGKKIWGTYYGGTGEEFHYGVDGSGSSPGVNKDNISLDPTGNILIVGGTYSLENIKVGCTYSGWREGVPQGNGFMAKFYPDGNIMWGSYYDIPPMNIACASSGSSFYMVTRADLDTLATPGAFQETKTPGAYAGYLAKMEGDYLCPDIEVLLDYNEGEGLLSTDSGFYDYQWFRNNEPVTGANDYQYAPVDSGTYYVRYKNACDCIYTSDAIWVSGGTRIKEVYRNELQVTLYPNPNHGVFTVTIDSEDRLSALNYKLTDVFGKIIYRGSLKTASPSFKQELQFPNLASGIYWLEISSDGRKAVRKISVYR